MGEIRKMLTTPLTKHATNNFWVEIKPYDRNGGGTFDLQISADKDFKLSFEQTDAARDAAHIILNAATFVTGVTFTLGKGVQGSVWAKKVAAGDDTVLVKVLS